MSHRLKKHFSDSKRARKIDIALIRLNTSHPRRFAHFHDGELFVLDIGVAAIDFTAQGIVRFACDP